MRSTTVDALYSSNGFWYIVVSPSSTKETYIITVDTTTGNPLYTGIPFIDIFPDHSMALKALTDIGAQVKIHGDGLIGLATTENSSTIGIVDYSKVTAHVPPRHKIRTVRHTSFIHIPLRGNNSKSSIFEDFQINENHFFCDTYDLTRLYPVDGISNPDRGFVWNNGWIKPFEILGIPQVCINLVQGVCVSKDFDKFGFSLAYVCRRSVLNPGTRYAARGLNDLNSPGNEVECELLFFKDDEFWSESWRRGSIPIRWKTVLTSKLASPKHTVDKDYFNGTCEYFKLLTERFGNIPIRCVSLLQTESDHAENEIKEFFTKALGQLFEHGIENVFFTPFDLNAHLHADGSGEAMMDFLSYIGPLGDGDGFTHGKFKSQKQTETNEPQAKPQQEEEQKVEGEEQKVEGEEQQVEGEGEQKVEGEGEQKVEGEGEQKVEEEEEQKVEGEDEQKAEGEEQRIEGEEEQKEKEREQKKSVEFKEVIEKDKSKDLLLDYGYEILERQQGLMRFNCADSLDRTNLATFYYAMKAAADWCKEKKVGLTKTPDADPYQPNLIIDQTIIDFLAIAFVNSGNVVSRLYTNTQAIKTNAIKKFSPSIVVSSSDTNITLQRRMQNVVNDPNRQKLIEMWTKPPPLSWYHRIDPRHMFVVPNINNSGENDTSIVQFPRAVFSPNIQQFDIESQELQMCLPTPMVLFSIMILMYPTNQKLNGVHITGGMDINHMDRIADVLLPQVESPTWLRYKPGNAIKWGYETHSQRYIRFLSFKFDSDDSKFSVGSIRIEAKSVFSREPVIIPHKMISLPENEEKEAEAKFEESFNEFLKSPRTLYDSIQLEKVRLDLNVHEDFRSKLALSRSISPWLVDTRSQLLATPTFLCALCGNPYGDMPKYFSPSDDVPSMIKPCKERNSGHSFPICPKCYEKAENLSKFTENYENEYKSIEIQPPHFETAGANDDFGEGIQCITNEATAAFLNEENSLLWHDGGSLVLQNNEEKDFLLFIVKQAIVLKIVINSTSDSFEVYDEKQNKLEMNRLNDNQIEFIFNEQPITQRLKFSIKSFQNDLELNRLQVYYIGTEYPIEEISPHPAEHLRTTHPALVTSTYEPSSRTETLKLDRESRIKAIMVEMVVEKGVTVPLSLYIAMYKKGELAGYKHIILPEASNGSKLWYKIDKDGVLADTVKVFYADRVATMRPHNLKFVIH
ncbi:hypothetical protein TRFO_03518 [Tritrichomonas foetus]|uniref:SAC domain-containing protein n=1 Tax=Tritrichomonas foetus TaxID=1144522 RepID=A0A1J4KP58_9EUKA|nr:hypothetical protein TRFO_03518 [Tritrichomonas foetus]|eukprot:OHT13081.1 hypothetical protein TRFO_03518 [Tritrichomonas foetus]